ncbi:hypothetical protein ACHQM5_009562 [Ranunculus cassubicifolius]
MSVSTKLKQRRVFLFFFTNSSPFLRRSPLAACRSPSPAAARRSPLLRKRFISSRGETQILYQATTFRRSHRVTVY